MVSKTLRVTVPVKSTEYAQARKHIWEAFPLHAISEGQKPMQPGEGILYLWIDEKDVQTSWAPMPMLSVFKADFTLVEYNDIVGIPLLYKVVQ